MMSAEQQLAAQPGAHLLGDRCAQRRDALAVTHRKQADEEREHLTRLDQHVEREQQQRDHAEDAADDVADGHDHRRCGAGAAYRRLLHGFADRDRPAQDADADQGPLRLRELLRQRPPQLLRLVDERRNDEHQEQGEDADDRRVDDQNRDPARHARADGDHALPLDRTDQR